MRIPPHSPSSSIARQSLPVMLALGSSLLACEAKQPAFSEPMTLGGREVPAATLNHGRDLYRMHCVSCHGETGAGDGPSARSLQFPPKDFRTGEFSFSEPGAPPSHEALIERIRTGAPERGMPTWKGMRDEDLSAIAFYLLTFSVRASADSPRREADA